MMATVLKTQVHSGSHSTQRSSPRLVHKMQLECTACLDPHTQFFPLAYVQVCLPFLTWTSPLRVKACSRVIRFSMPALARAVDSPTSETVPARAEAAWPAAVETTVEAAVLAAAAAPVRGGDHHVCTPVALSGQSISPKSSFLITI